MAAWDALAKAAGVPLAVFLGGTVGPVPAYNSNGLWLTPMNGQDWADPVLSEPFQLEDGHLLVPDKPGLGIEWNERAVVKFAQ